ncbi:12916_t:CDS:1, partial [Gigaspora margarita]
IFSVYIKFNISELVDELLKESAKYLVLKMLLKIARFALALISSGISSSLIQGSRIAAIKAVLS